MQLDFINRTSDPIPPDELRASPWKLDELDGRDYQPYTGIGHPRTPQRIEILAQRIGEALADLGRVLRGRTATHTDTAFKWGANLVPTSHTEIYVPEDDWPGCKGPHYHPPSPLGIKGARKAWSKHRSRIDLPPFDDLDAHHQRRIAVAVQTVLGPDLHRPSQFVVVWTPGGATTSDEVTAESGMTGQAVAVADYMDIPVFNLRRDDHRNRIAGRFDIPDSILDAYQ